MPSLEIIARGREISSAHCKGRRATVLGVLERGERGIPTRYRAFCSCGRTFDKNLAPAAPKPAKEG